ncbi:YcdB/YcdC domain-containing protein [Alkaliphilus serpentinus]|uniref:SLH domain-containing protein n=1 Tax=Alkaliphilus serpentinus TaxID=1482731 RepID=A0A833HQW5_9FIRM|nr:S-layer homology domain-containing protein [Alkaliphilus serpentinus]KAB3532488.1 hypothetical protein F8153_02300 [Alkaliphilus serpentinus]
MKLKKAVSITLVAGLLVSSLGFAYGNEEVSEPEIRQSKAVKAVKQTIEISEEKAEALAKDYIKDFFGQDVDTSTYEKRVEYGPYWGSQGEYTWMISYHKYTRDSSNSFEIVLKADTGEIKQIYRYKYDRETENNVTKYNRDELKEVAENFLKKVNPTLTNELVYDENQQYYTYYSSMGLRPTQYHYNFTRVENGIKVAGDGVAIGVDSGTGEVVSYSYNWSDDQLPTTEDIISIEEARELYKDEITLQLSYLPKRGDYYYMYQPETEEIKIVYNPVMERGYLLDAATGEFINGYGSANEGITTIDITDAQRKEFEGVKAEKVEREKELTQEEATEMATEILNDLYQQEVKIQHTNFSTYYRGNTRRRTWNINFTLNDNNYVHGSIAIDALTEEIMNVHYYDYRAMEKMMYEKPMEKEDSYEVEALEYPDAYNKAIEIIKKLYPDKLDNIQTEQTYHGNHYHPEFYFNFNRIENDIPYHYNHISVSINATTGLPQSIYFRWDDVELPKPEGLLPEETILSKYTEDINLQLQYTKIYTHNYPEPPTFETKLVYANTGLVSTGMFNIIDAVTGEYLNYNGQTIKEHNKRNDQFNDIIEGHEAEKELKIMIDNGMLDLDKYSLQDAIPKKEVIKMMVLANGYYHHMIAEAGDLKFLDVDKNDEYYQYIQAAVYQGILTDEEVELGLNETVTREELAEMLVKLVRLEKIAEVEGIYTLPVDDVDEINSDLLGHIALVYGMEIMGDVDGSFSPKAEATMIDVAIGIYRAFSKLGIRY